MITLRISHLGIAATIVALAALLNDVSADEPVGQGETPSIVQQIQADTTRLTPLVSSKVGCQFLAATAHLPKGEARRVYLSLQTKQFYANAEPDALSAEERRTLRPIDLKAARFYTTKYGTPMAYSRPIDLVGNAGLETLAGCKILDFGYGTLAPLRLLGIAGADAIGVDIDSFLSALYSHPTDQGVLVVDGSKQGSVKLVNGHWPADERVRQAVGTGYDVVISKNTLKRGYIHPDKKVDVKRYIQIGVNDETFCRALYGILRPGGLAIMYNLSPAQNSPDEPYLPAADGRCPFSRAVLERVGFEVLNYNADDSEAARAMAKALQWDQGDDGIDLEADLFGNYTLVKKTRE